MSMIEVDPKLFITCRLCLDEMGLYQIVPKVQMQIKYCFEIDVQPFDGLPQLICKKCESILSQYAGIKQMYQVKQDNLKSIKNKAPVPPEENVEELKEKDVIQQQQDTVSSTQQVETVSPSTSSPKKINKKKLSLTKKVHSVDCESNGSKSNGRSTPNNSFTNKNQAKRKHTNKVKREKLAWASKYSKQFVCRICSKGFCEKRYVISHINKHENMIMKYSRVLNTHCEIKINRVGSAPNITNSLRNVVFNENKIVSSVNSKYYILYSSNSNQFSKKESSLESSDEEVLRNVGKYKRQRLISEDSDKSTVIIEPENRSVNSIDIEEHAPVTKSIECEAQKSDSSIDCVNIDSDSTSTQSTKTNKEFETEKQQDALNVKKNLITSIISMCYMKYLKRFDNSKSVSKPHGNMDSFLQHKVLSIGTKTIHSMGLNSTGLLRYLEHKNLDIAWKQTKNLSSPIIVKTSLISAKSTDNDVNELGWKSLNDLDPNHTTKDFVDIFENLVANESSQALEDREEAAETSQPNSNPNGYEKEVSTYIPLILNEENKNEKQNITNSYNNVQSSETQSSGSETHYDTGNAVLLLRSALESDKQTCKKLLNANPVPYPKQLPTKKSGVQDSATSLKSPPHASGAGEATLSLDRQTDNTFVNFNNDVCNMPVITSTVSLASLEEDHKQKQSNSNTTSDPSINKSMTNLPQIKVKPMSELMPDRSAPNNPSLANVSGWTVTSPNLNENVVLHGTNSNLVYVTNVPQYTSVSPLQPVSLCYPQILCSVSQVNSGQPDSNSRTQRKRDQELVIMHTVELPNTKTNSPFRYFQKLLQIHNLTLLESTVGISHFPKTMKCLIKFSLGFQQENNAPVTLCLTFYCDKNVFCIKVRDNALKDIDVSKLSANWQWEILKVFRGDIVNKLTTNALKHGLDMSSKVNYFVSLLKAIVFSKDK